MTSNSLNIATAPKTSSFQMRINPEIKQTVEDIFAKCGMTMADAVNTFFQQSINVGGLPFIVSQNTKEALREQATAKLMLEISKGEESAKKEGWISEEELARGFGVKL